MGKGSKVVSASIEECERHESCWSLFENPARLDAQAQGVETASVKERCDYCSALVQVDVAAVADANCQLRMLSIRGMLGRSAFSC
eukprot:4271795-Amphidinium_carterae.1